MLPKCNAYYGDRALNSSSASAFGFDPRHHDLSLRIGELGLLPEVRRAAADTMVIACGYSCREQIAQCTEREGLHVADVARLALSPTRAVAN